MSDQFRLRFRILIGKPLTSKEPSLTLNFEGRDVLVKSHVKDQPLSETAWIVLQVTGFPSEDELHFPSQRPTSSRLIP
jgi:hypothetical protein